MYRLSYWMAKIKEFSYVRNDPLKVQTPDLNIIVNLTGKFMFTNNLSRLDCDLKIAQAFWAMVAHHYIYMIHEDTQHLRGYKCMLFCFRS